MAHIFHDDVVDGILAVDASVPRFPRKRTRQGVPVDDVVARADEAVRVAFKKLPAHGVAVSHLFIMTENRSTSAAG